MTGLFPKRYRAVRHLSETLYGGVFLCEDRQPTKTQATCSPADEPARVVLKQIEIMHAMQLLNAPDSNAQAVDDPRQEKALSNMLRRTGGHPNIVQYLDDFIEDRMLYFVMEYCSDGDLYEYLSHHEKSMMDPMDALACVAQVSAGVAFLHEQGIAHRDLSLENVMLHEGVCKVGDFGLSTRTNRLCTERVGKAYYMAPEVVAGEAYDPKAADMWSLGIMLFILLTGSPLVPVASDDDKAFGAFKRAGVRAVLESWGVVSRLSVEVVDLLTGLLQVDPVQRLSIEQVLHHRAFASWTACASPNELPEAIVFAAPEPEMLQT